MFNAVITKKLAGLDFVGPLCMILYYTATYRIFIAQLICSFSTPHVEMLQIINTTEQWQAEITCEYIVNESYNSLFYFIHTCLFHACLLLSNVPLALGMALAL